MFTETDGVRIRNFSEQTSYLGCIFVDESAKSAFGRLRVFFEVCADAGWVFSFWESF